MDLYAYLLKFKVHWHIDDLKHYQWQNTINAKNEVGVLRKFGV